jgi:L-cysteine:1D-myo-inositol 2-amino-2-deoxy-alpha-D-glucopyranoside ligase
MSLNALGSTIDIHGGGKDLVFPHHECKRAISEALTGQPFVKHWVRAAVVNYAAVTGRGGADPRSYVAEVRAVLDEDLNVPRALRAVPSVSTGRDHRQADDEPRAAAWPVLSADPTSVALHHHARDRQVSRQAGPALRA